MGKYITTNPDGFDDLYSFPHPKNGQLPIIVIARLSLSFPFLFRAVPIYQQYYKSGDDTRYYKECLLSDGGISSNFPIHLFDNIIPGRQTFGIRLGEITENDSLGCGQNRIVIPSPGPKNVKVDSIGTFVKSMFNTAKDWRDNLQSELQSYADRIVTINLNPDNEGGLNLNMDNGDIDCLKTLGTLAGESLLRDVNINMNRQTRARAALQFTEEMAVNFHRAYENGSWKPVANNTEPSTWSEILSNFKEHWEYAEEINAMGEVRTGNRLPRPLSIYADLRIVASEDIEPLGSRITEPEKGNEDA